MIAGSLEAEPPINLETTEALVRRLVEESQKHQIKRQENPDDPVWNAELAAAGLAADTSAYNEQMLEVLKRYAIRGDFGEAEYVAGNLPGNGGVRAHAELALACARKGRKEDATRHVKLAADQIPQLSGQQAEKVRGTCAHVLHLIGREKEAKELQTQLGELELLSLEARLHEEDRMPVLNLAQAIERLARLQAKGVGELRALFLLACARQQFLKGSIETGRAFFPEVGRLATDEGLPHAQHVLVELSRAAWLAGETKEAHKALNVFLKCCEGYPANAEWKAPYLADAVSLLLDWKENDKARTWLETAEAGLSKVFVLDAPQAILAVAKQREKLEGAMAADDLVTQAAKAGRAHPHPRAHAAASVLICLYYADVGRSIPASVLKLLSHSPQEEVN